jgi:hypothetical protein
LLWFEEKQTIKKQKMVYVDFGNSKSDAKYKQTVDNNLQMRIKHLLDKKKEEDDKDRTALKQSAPR